MSPVLATIDEDTARQVAADIREYGRGCVVFDREGRAHHLPSYLVIANTERDERGDRRMHE